MSKVFISKNKNTEFTCYDSIVEIKSIVKNMDKSIFDAITIFEASPKYRGDKVLVSKYDIKDLFSLNYRSATSEISKDTIKRIAGQILNMEVVSVIKESEGTHIINGSYVLSHKPSEFELYFNFNLRPIQNL